MNIKVEGMNELNKILSGLTPKIMNATEKSLKKSLLDLKGKAQEQAPVDTGDLQGSANSGVSVSGVKIDGFVSFDTPYATRQHEELDYSHPKGGKAKYLEQPLAENIDKYVSFIVDEIGKAGIK